MTSSAGARDEVGRAPGGGVIAKALETADRRKASAIPLESEIRMDAVVGIGAHVAASVYLRSNRTRCGRVGVLGGMVFRGAD